MLIQSEDKGIDTAKSRASESLIPDIIARMPTAEVSYIVFESGWLIIISILSFDK